jgi:hypothetical protein
VARARLALDGHQIRFEQQRDHSQHGECSQRPENEALEATEILAVTAIAEPNEHDTERDPHQHEQSQPTGREVRELKLQLGAGFDFDPAPLCQPSQKIIHRVIPA